jgi:hypothetical protein
MIDWSRQVEEEFLDPNRIIGVESRGPERADLACGPLQSPEVSGGEDNVRSLPTRPPRRFEPDASASANHDNGLSEEFGLAIGPGGEVRVHDSSEAIQDIRLGSTEESVFGLSVLCPPFPIAPFTNANVINKSRLLGLNLTAAFQASRVQPHDCWHSE